MEKTFILCESSEYINKVDFQSRSLMDLVGKQNNKNSDNSEGVEGQGSRKGKIVADQLVRDKSQSKTIIDITILKPLIGSPTTWNAHINAKGREGKVETNHSKKYEGTTDDN